MKGQSKWFEFANEDLIVAGASLKQGVYNQACFHSQQGVEKTLKGFLRYKKRAVPRSHSLKELLALCADIDSEFKNLRDRCISLDRYYIFTRYPDALPGILPEGMPGKNDAKEALSVLEEIMDFVKHRIQSEV